MVPNDDFQKALQSGKLSEALMLAMNQAVDLKITTWVASSADDPAQEDKAHPGSRLHTRVNLLSGEIENEVGAKFLATGPYEALRQFHLNQVEKSNQKIQDNFHSLQELLKLLIALQQYNGIHNPNQGLNLDFLDVQSQSLPSGPSPIAQETEELTGNLSIPEPPPETPEAIAPMAEEIDLGEFTDGGEMIDPTEAAAPLSLDPDFLVIPAMAPEKPPEAIAERPLTDLDVEDWEAAANMAPEPNGEPDHGMLNLLDDLDLGEEEEAEEFWNDDPALAIADDTWEADLSEGNLEEGEAEESEAEDGIELLAGEEEAFGDELSLATEDLEREMAIEVENPAFPTVAEDGEDLEGLGALDPEDLADFDELDELNELDELEDLETLNNLDNLGDFAELDDLEELEEEDDLDPEAGFEDLWDENELLDENPDLGAPLDPADGDNDVGETPLVEDQGPVEEEGTASPDIAPPPAPPGAAQNPTGEGVQPLSDEELALFISVDWRDDPQVQHITSLDEEEPTGDFSDRPEGETIPETAELDDIELEDWDDTSDQATASELEVLPPPGEPSEPAPLPEEEEEEEETFLLTELNPEELAELEEIEEESLGLEEDWDGEPESNLVSPPTLEELDELELGESATAIADDDPLEDWELAGDDLGEAWEESDPEEILGDEDLSLDRLKAMNPEAFDEAIAPDLEASDLGAMDDFNGDLEPDDLDLDLPGEESLEDFADASLTTEPQETGEDFDETYLQGLVDGDPSSWDPGDNLDESDLSDADLATWEDGELEALADPALNLEEPPEPLADFDPLADPAVLDSADFGDLDPEADPENWDELDGSLGDLDDLGEDFAEGDGEDLASTEDQAWAHLDDDLESLENFADGADTDWDDQDPLAHDDLMEIPEGDRQALGEVLDDDGFEKIDLGANLEGDFLDDDLEDIGNLEELDDFEGDRSPTVIADEEELSLDLGLEDLEEDSADLGEVFDGNTMDLDGELGDLGSEDLASEDLETLGLPENGDGFSGEDFESDENLEDFGDLEDLEDLEAPSPLENQGELGDLGDLDDLEDLEVSALDEDLSLEMSLDMADFSDQEGDLEDLEDLEGSALAGELSLEMSLEMEELNGESGLGELGDLDLEEDEALGADLLTDPEEITADAPETPAEEAWDHWPSEGDASAPELDDLDGDGLTMAPGEFGEEGTDLGDLEAWEALDQELALDGEDLNLEADLSPETDDLDLAIADENLDFADFEGDFAELDTITESGDLGLDDLDAIAEDSDEGLPDDLDALTSDFELNDLALDGADLDLAEDENAIADEALSFSDLDDLDLDLEDLSTPETDSDPQKSTLPMAEEATPEPTLIEHLAFDQELSEEDDGDDHWDEIVPDRIPQLEQEPTPPDLTLDEADWGDLGADFEENAHDDQFDLGIFGEMDDQDLDLDWDEGEGDTATDPPENPFS